MKRRAFITRLGAIAATWPIAARAQQPSRIWRVGYLSPVPATAAASFTLFAAFRLRLQELGYVEGRNLVLDVRRADGDRARFPGLAAELVSLRPNVIVAVGTPATAAVQKATSSIPIVMLLVADPVASGFVKSLAKPGGNTTGLSYMGPDLGPKLFELLRLVVPGAQRVAVLVSDNPFHPMMIQDYRALAQTWGLRIVPVKAIAEADLEEAFEKMRAEKCDALLVLADTRNSRRMVELASKIRIPAIYQVSDLVRMGGLLSYSPDGVDLMSRGAVYVDRILKGAAPAELPVEQPAKFELRINLKTAKALGLTIPDALLVRADEVIE
jgi:putative ABC transport system substrate-binding protein